MNDLERRALMITRMYKSILKSAKFHRLTYGARLLYISMLSEGDTHAKFTFPRKTAERYGISPRTLVRGVQELVDAGFLICRSGRSTRTESEYEFSKKWNANNCI